MCLHAGVVGYILNVAFACFYVLCFVILLLSFLCLCLLHTLYCVLAFVFALGSGRLLDLRV